jgi:hypothetical protein
LGRKNLAGIATTTGDITIVTMIAAITTTMIPVTAITENNRLQSPLQKRVFLWNVWQSGEIL